MTYFEYVAEMRAKFPNHPPMRESDFNAMIRVEKEEGKIISSVREGYKRLLEPTLNNYTKIETHSNTSRKNSSNKSGDKRHIA